MCGASGIEVLSYAKDVLDGEAQLFGGEQLLILGVAMIVSFLVSGFVMPVYYNTNLPCVNRFLEKTFAEG